MVAFKNEIPTLRISDADCLIIGAAYATNHGPDHEKLEQYGHTSEILVKESPLAGADEFAAYLNQPVQKVIMISCTFLKLVYTLGIMPLPDYTKGIALNICKVPQSTDDFIAGLTEEEAATIRKHDEVQVNLSLKTIGFGVFHTLLLSGKICFDSIDSGELNLKELIESL